MHANHFRDCSVASSPPNTIALELISLKFMCLLLAFAFRQSHRITSHLLIISMEINMNQLFRLVTQKASNNFSDI